MMGIAKVEERAPMTVGRSVAKRAVKLVLILVAWTAVGKELIVVEMWVVRSADPKVCS